MYICITSYITLNLKGKYIGIDIESKDTSIVHLQGLIPTLANNMHKQL